LSASTLLFFTFLFYQKVLENYYTLSTEYSGIQNIRTVLNTIYQLQIIRELEYNGKDSTQVEALSMEAANQISDFSTIPEVQKNNESTLDSIVSQLLVKHKEPTISKEFIYKEHSLQIDMLMDIARKIYYNTHLAHIDESTDYYFVFFSAVRFPQLLESIKNIESLTTEPHQKTFQISNGLYQIGYQADRLFHEISYLINNSTDFSRQIKDLSEHIQILTKDINAITTTSAIAGYVSINKSLQQLSNKIKTLQVALFDHEIKVIADQKQEYLILVIIFPFALALFSLIMIWFSWQFYTANKRNTKIIKAIHEGRKKLIYALNENDIYNTLCDNLIKVLDLKLAWIGIAQNNANKTVTAVAASGEAIEYIKNIVVTWGDDITSFGPSGMAIKTKKNQIFNDLENNQQFQPWKNDAKKYGLRSSATIPLILQNRVIGALALYSPQKNSFYEKDLTIIEELINDSMFNLSVIKTRYERDELLNSQNIDLKTKVIEKNKKIIEIQDATVLSLAALVESRDKSTSNHIKRTQIYIKILLDNIKDHSELSRSLTLEKKGYIYKSAPLHDIGKIGIPDHILNKPAPLTEEEFNIMKTHTTIGADAIHIATEGLADEGFLTTAKEIIKHHHERWDGNGYPDKLAGNKIPGAARLMSLADMYDALISERVYKPAYSHEMATSIINDEKGKSLDPELVDIFLAHADLFHTAAVVYAEN